MELSPVADQSSLATIPFGCETSAACEVEFYAQLTPGSMAQLRARVAKVIRRNFATPILFAHSFTTCQTPSRLCCPRCGSFWSRCGNPAWVDCPLHMSSDSEAFGDSSLPMFITSPPTLHMSSDPEAFGDCPAIERRGSGLLCAFF